MTKSSKLGFSLIELSVVILIIGILVIGVSQGSRMIISSKLASARSLTSGSPVQSTANLVFWVETSLDGSLTNASGSTSPNDGDQIASWTDKSISNSNIVVGQSNTTYRPIYLQNGINSLPSITTTTACNVLYSTIVPLPVSSSQYTMIAVWRQQSNAGTLLVEQKPSSSTNNRHAGIWLANLSFKFTGFNNDSTSSLGTLSLEKNFIGAIAVNTSAASGSVFQGYLNTNTPTSSAASDVSSLNLGNDLFTVGGRATTVGSYNSCPKAWISEVIIFSRALKQSEITNINNYLSQKYSIKLS
jgi:prepilin-type N-terminal cleavage/methylation domain-containing protein